jgi:protein SCO1
MKRSRESSPIWVVVVAASLVVGAILLVRPTKSAGVFEGKFSFDSKVGGYVPINTALTDHTGKAVKLSDYMKPGRPVMLLPIFYKCNGVCYNEVESLTKMLAKEVAVSTKSSSESVIPGRDFDLVVVSIHPNEIFQQAAAKRAELMSIFRLGMEPISDTAKIFRPNVTSLSTKEVEKLNGELEQGIHFTVGKVEDVKALTAAMGFKYTYDAKKDWVDHPAAAAYLTPAGRIVGYNTGSQFATLTVRTGIKDAGNNVTEPVDAVLLGCFKMENVSKGTRIVVSMLNTFGILTAFGIVGLIWQLNRKHPNSPISPSDSSSNK